MGYIVYFKFIVVPRVFVVKPPTAINFNKPINSNNEYNVFRQIVENNPKNKLKYKNSKR